MIMLSHEVRQEAKRLNEEAAKILGRKLYQNEGARKCPKCGELLIVSFDDSCGMVDSAAAECGECLTVTAWHINWWIDWEFTGIAA